MIDNETLEFSVAASRQFSYQENTQDIRAGVPGIDEMMRKLEKGNDGSCFLLTNASQCQELFPFLADNTSLYFCWLPNEADDDIEYFSRTWPCCENRFVNFSMSCSAFLMWYRKNGGCIAIENKYLIPLHCNEKMFAIAFANRNIIATSILCFDEHDVGALQAAAMSAQNFMVEDYPEALTLGRDESEIYLSGEMFRFN